MMHSSDSASDKLTATFISLLYQRYFRISRDSRYEFFPQPSGSHLGVGWLGMGWHPLGFAHVCASGRGEVTSRSILSEYEGLPDEGRPFLMRHEAWYLDEQSGGDRMGKSAQQYFSNQEDSQAKSAYLQAQYPEVKPLAFYDAVLGAADADFPL